MAHRFDVLVSKSRMSLRHLTQQVISGRGETVDTRVLEARAQKA